MEYIDLIKDILLFVFGAGNIAFLGIIRRQKKAEADLKEIESLKQIIEQNQNEIGRLNDRITSLETRNSELQERNSKLQDEIYEIKQKMAI